jgi:hypothetical protein
MTTVVRMTSAVLEDIRTHLFPAGNRLEHGGFILARFQQSEGYQCFVYLDWLPLARADYVEQATDYLELSDTARAGIIKRAHDHSAAIVEVHSHPGPYPAAFSPADLAGLREFVPHVRWRLKGCPYAALVFAQSGIDGLAWTGASHHPIQLDRIDLESGYVCTTGLTLALRSRRSYGQV